MLLAAFCKKAGIPFDCYAFTNNTVVRIRCYEGELELGRFIAKVFDGKSDLTGSA